MSIIGLMFVIFYIIDVEGGYIGRLCGNDWSERGRYPDNLTVEWCINYCQSVPARYAGLLMGKECFCSDSIAKYILCHDTSGDDPLCKSRCPVNAGIVCNGDPSMVCGGPDWYSIYDSAHNTSSVITDCATTIADVCSIGQPCTWTCALSDPNCPTTSLIDGTVVYDDRSSFCGAATHDLRFHYYPRPITVFRFRPSALVTTKGSWKFGISSGWRDAAGEARFTSDRLWDFAQGTNNYAYYDSLAGSGQCFLEPRSTGYDLFLSLLDLKQIAGSYTGSLPISSNATSELSFCGILDHRTGLRVPTSFIPIVLAGPHPTVTARFLTVTAMPGNVVQLAFAYSGTNAAKYRIVKRGYTLVSSVVLPNANGFALNFGSVSVQDTGFYEIFINNENTRAAVTRLVVIEYPYPNSFMCSGNGMARADGTCICKHPFRGPHCNQTCAAGQLGPICAVTCPTPDCRGMVLCSPDPIGCHCAAGWHSTNCNTPCPLGTFGPDCNNIGCHCANASSCNQVTGYCTNGGCKPGYFGLRCDETGPSLGRAPTAVNGSFDRVTVEWPQWEMSLDLGQRGPPDFYVLEMRSTGSFATLANVSYANVPTYYHLVTGLTVSILYQFQVTTFYRGFRMLPSPILNYTAFCQQPTSPGQIRNATLIGNATAAVMWTYPQPSTWRCASIYSAALQLTCTELICGSATVSRTIPISTNNTSTVITKIPAYSNCSLQLIISNNPQSTPVASNAVTLRTRDGVPGSVTGFRAIQTANNSLIFLWNPPNANGVLDALYIRVNKPIAADSSLSKEDLFTVDTTGKMVKLAPNATSYEYTPSDTSKAQILRVGLLAGNKDFNGSESVTTVAFNPVSSGSNSGGKSSGWDSDNHAFFWITIFILAVVVMVLLMMLVGFAVTHFRKRSRRDGSSIDSSSDADLPPLERRPRYTRTTSKPSGISPYENPSAPSPYRAERTIGTAGERASRDEEFSL